MEENRIHDGTGNLCFALRTVEARDCGARNVGIKLAFIADERPCLLSCDRTYYHKSGVLAWARIKTLLALWFALVDAETIIQTVIKIFIREDENINTATIDGRVYIGNEPKTIITRVTRQMFIFISLFDGFTIVDHDTSMRVKEKNSRGVPSSCQLSK